MSTRLRLTAALWFVLALLTLYLVVTDDGYDAVVAAFVAWVGGLVTARMFRILREGNPQ